MAGLVKRFGSGVELTGFNYSRAHGGPGLMRKGALRRKIFTAAEFRRLRNKPSFIYLDAAKRLPFASGSFDFIYSASAIYLFTDKAFFIEECNRVLAKSGVARLEIAERVRRAEQAEEYTHSWEIWEGGRPVRPADYLSRFSGITVGRSSDPDVFGIELRKRPALDLGLRLVASVDSNLLWRGWMGVKSVYTTQKALKPYWR
jgi:SAM-dependent methyltransferase